DQAVAEGLAPCPDLPAADLIDLGRGELPTVGDAPEEHAIDLLDLALQGLPFLIRVRAEDGLAVRHLSRLQCLDVHADLPEQTAHLDLSEEDADATGDRKRVRVNVVAGGRDVIAAARGCP